jgi:repressor LexA
MLTYQQKRTLEFVVGWMEAKGTSPTVRDVARAISAKGHPSTAHKALKGLEERGFIRRLPDRARTIEVLRNPIAKMRTCYFLFDVDTKSLVPYRPKQS